jgi:hypothetical protein
MHSAEPLQLRIEVDRDRKPITGRVHTDGQPARCFAGWTELFAALDAAIEPELAQRNDRDADSAQRRQDR